MNTSATTRYVSPTRAARELRRGFSLVELMVVTAIIIIMVSILLSVTASPAADRHTQMILSTAHAVATEYRLQTSVVVNHASTTPFDWSTAKTKNANGASGTGMLNGTVAVSASERFVWAVNQLPATEQMLRNLGTEVLTDSDGTGVTGEGFLELVDGWGRKLIYVSGVDHGDSVTDDDYLPEYPKPYFVSAGADGQWGDVQAASGSAALAQTEDNLYSFDLEGKMPQR